MCVKVDLTNERQQINLSPPHVKVWVSVRSKAFKVIYACTT